jgi:hypothetical protein
MSGPASGLRGRLVTAVLFLVSCGLSLILLESSLAYLVGRGRMDIERSSYCMANVKSDFWVDLDPDFGAWHKPGSRYRHAKRCFDVTYTANAFGARDRERQGRVEGPRVVVLGDSFTEGYGLPTEARFSDVLEKLTGIEHLNFGVAGDFGPLQEALLYRKLASKFSHDGVVVALFPDNDFRDMDPALAGTFYAGRYRPYLEGAYPDYRLAYHGPAYGAALKPRGPIAWLGAFLREFSYTFRALSYVRRRLGLGKGGRAPGAPGEPAGASGYYDFTEADFQRLRWSLDALMKDARAAGGGKGAKVLVATLPRELDLDLFKERGEPPLSRRLRDWAAASGADYLDLLPIFARARMDGQKLFLECDGHWSPSGDSKAAESMLGTWPYYAQAEAARKVR